MDSSLVFIGEHRPSLEELKRALGEAGDEAKGRNLAPVYRELAADLETPVSVLLKLRQRGWAFLFESVEGGERVARYSFLGTNPKRVLMTGEGFPAGDVDPLGAAEDMLRPLNTFRVPGLDLPPFTGGAVGYVGYDCVKHFEPRTAAAINGQKRICAIPDALWMLCDTLVVFDRARHSIKVIAHVDLEAEDLDEAYGAACASVDAICRHLAGSLPELKGAASSEGEVLESDWNKYSNVGQEGYEGFVNKLKEHIVGGDIIQAVPSQRLALPTPPTLTALGLYRRMRVTNPSPYMFYVSCGEWEGVNVDLEIVGASPEMLCRVVDGTVETHPIAGTRRRGKSEKEDLAMEEDLLGDAKERAEHVMLVDLGRNDVGRVAAPGTVRVPRFMTVERYSHVMHIVSRVQGDLAPGKTAYDAFRSIFPAGTVSGAPKVRAIELVASLETERRHVYAGAVGYIGFGPEPSRVLDTAISIRTAWIHNNTLHCQAGGGIVYDSEPTAEYHETLAKLAGVVRAAHGASTATTVPKQ